MDTAKNTAPRRTRRPSKHGVRGSCANPQTVRYTGPGGYNIRKAYTPWTHIEVYGPDHKSTDLP